MERCAALELVRTGGDPIRRLAGFQPREDRRMAFLCQRSGEMVHRNTRPWEFFSQSGPDVSVCGSAVALVSRLQDRRPDDAHFTRPSPSRPAAIETCRDRVRGRNSSGSSRLQGLDVLFPLRSACMAAVSDSCPVLRMALATLADRFIAGGLSLGAAYTHNSIRQLAVGRMSRRGHPEHQANLRLSDTAAEREASGCGQARNALRLRAAQKWISLRPLRLAFDFFSGPGIRPRNRERNNNEGLRPIAVRVLRDQTDAN